MYIKKPSYSGSNPLKKIASTVSRKYDDDEEVTRNKLRRETAERVNEKDRAVDRADRNDSPVNRSDSAVDRAERPNRRDRSDSHRSHRDSNRDERGERLDRPERHASKRDRSDRDRRERGDRRERRNTGGDRERGDRGDRERSDRDRSDRDRSDKGHRSSRKTSSKPVVASGAVAKKSKITVPKNIAYRPGRLQSLTADEEVILKQVWANFCKYVGFDVDISSEDIKYKESFIPSSSSVNSTDSNGLSKTATRTSLQSATSGKTSQSKKKKGFFGGGSTEPVELSAPADSPRLHDIQTKSSSEKFIPTDKPSNNIINAYVNQFKLNFKNSPDYQSDDEDEGAAGGYSDDDNLSLESFVTADTTITNPDDFPTENFSKGKSSGSGATSSNALYSSAPKTQLKSHPEVNADLARITPHDLVQAFCNAARNDLPDNFFLRFVRARKWNSDNALKMFSNSIIWRGDFPADKWILEGDAPSYLHGKNQGLVKNFTAEKSWIRGEDNGQNPIFWFLAKKHFGSDSPSDETQRYAVVTIEWCRLFLKEVNASTDTCSIFFDLTGFTLKNADYTTIKFLADVFEAHYPECLGRIYVHNAPWIFSTVWNIIKNWLDPVVASKIVFTKNFKDLSTHISPDFIPTELGGIDSSGPDYPVPQKGDDLPPKPKDATYRRLKNERDELYMKFFTTTVKWVESTNPEVSSKYLEERLLINTELSYNYLELDPYIRIPGPFDRNGVLKVAN